jgi:hypothetical protein
VIVSSLLSVYVFSRGYLSFVICNLSFATIAPDVSSARCGRANGLTRKLQHAVICYEPCVREVFWVFRKNLLEFLRRPIKYIS